MNDAYAPGTVVTFTTAGSTGLGEVTSTTARTLTLQRPDGSTARIRRADIGRRVQSVNPLISAASARSLDGNALGDRVAELARTGLPCASHARLLQDITDWVKCNDLERAYQAETAARAALATHFAQPDHPWTHLSITAMITARLRNQLTMVQFHTYARHREGNPPF